MFIIHQEPNRNELKFSSYKDQLHMYMSRTYFLAPCLFSFSLFIWWRVQNQLNVRALHTKPTFNMIIQCGFAVVQPFFYTSKHDMAIIWGFIFPKYKNKRDIFRSISLNLKSNNNKSLWRLPSTWSHPRSRGNSRLTTWNKQ